MSEENNQNNVEQPIPAEAQQDPLANIDLNSLDFNNPETLPEALRNAKVYMPPRHIVHAIMSNYRARLANPYGGRMTPRISKSWFNGELISTEEYNKLPAEETFAYRNKITKAKKQ